MKVYVVTSVYEPTKILGVFSNMTEVKGAIVYDYAQTWLENCEVDANIDAMILYFGITDILKEEGPYLDYLIREVELDRVLKD